MAIRLRTRTGLIFATALASQLIVLAGVSASYGVSRLDRTRFAQVYAPGLEASRRMNADAYEMLSLEFVLLKDTAQATSPNQASTVRDSVLKRYEEAREDFEGAFRLARSLPQTPHEQALLERIGAQYAKARAAHQRLVTLVAARRLEEAGTLHRMVAGPAMFELHSKSGALYDSRSQQIKALNTNAGKNADLMMAFSLTISMLGALLTLVLWLRASRQLVEPLLNLQGTATAIANGEFVEAHAPGADRTVELAALQDDFNLMSSRLRAMTGRLRDANATLETEVAERTADLRTANDQLQRMIEELRSLDRLKSDFMAVMSHELLTPINFIIGFGSALEDELMGALNDKQLEAVGKMLAGAERLTRMVRNTIEYAQLEAGKLEVLPRPFALADALDEALTRLKPALDGRRQHVRITRPDALDEALGDPDRTAQVLYELLDNAAKYSPEGADIHVTLAEADDRLTTTIADHGTGIPAEALPNLFTPFFQANFTRTREHGGMGLGLAIAHHLVARMGGELTVASPAAGGTVVSFWLPVSDRAATDVGHVVGPGSSFS